MKTILVLTLLSVSIQTFANDLISSFDRCEYHNNRVIDIKNDKGKGTKKVCFAEVFCSKKDKKTDKVQRVTKKIVCGLDTTGNCPSAKACHTDKLMNIQLK